MIDVHVVEAVHSRTCRLDLRLPHRPPATSARPAMSTVLVEAADVGEGLPRSSIRCMRSAATPGPKQPVEVIYHVGLVEALDLSLATCKRVHRFLERANTVRPR